MPNVVYLLILLAVIVWRALSILPRTPRGKAGRRRSSQEQCSIAVFLGSGGHTSEAITLLSSLDFSRYGPRTYIYSQGDSLSAKKATELEFTKAAECTSHLEDITDADSHCTFIIIPRARHVHQSLLTTPFTAARSLAVCLYHVTLKTILGRPFADLLVLNGPGTCCMLCLAVYLNRFLGLSSPHVIYVESFARVRSLSLSGKLLRPFVDRFVVQWPELLSDGGRGECRGWLV
ncbi:glycosyltransferase family 1 protein [Panus rudis PR-1116 ss-1]|nr:glycosyltransferase family 1 protein [Panus rudis PR-1116 ss-1]